MSEYNIIGMIGSLRRESYNRKLFLAAEELAPDGMHLRAADISGIPAYNDDIRSNDGFPASVQVLRDQIQEADGVLIVSPEYNYSMPGFLKNAIDWVSRGDHPFAQKPVAIMGASPGNIGTARMQYHLRQTLVFLDAYTLNKPEIMVGRAYEKFDEDGRLTDEKTREFVGKQLQAFADWIDRVGK